ncbi:MAG: TIGR03084 family protein [Desulfobacteraceae bacterium]|nr:MAG: TIGR03084 family protein [Desulfobacteraceae bacterium]
MKPICSDLRDQYRELDELVSGLTDAIWFQKTPFFSWTIFDEVAHIAFFDQQALLAAEEPDRFKKQADDVVSLLAVSESWPKGTNPMLGVKDPQGLLLLWRDTRSRLIERLQTLSPQDRLPWYGPDMSAKSFATARLMEAWAHSQDVFDSLQKRRSPSSRLRHVAHIGFTTFAWSFFVRGMTPPDPGPRLELRGTEGEIWVWGKEGARDRVIGSAEDFCLVVTQRRNVADTSLSCQGPNAGKWLSIAQAFAGVPQEPPAPGVRLVSYEN